ncbi:unnamed protein product [Prorocentrum cordatum]|uniref:Mei2-like C-terminal RNA recognition motif domain-containing protein n=1 Tax=Prorocentrum cordatum TaxID=2364126 RepID=A0ABN9X1F3_9DINO|nr:unnamed protein product [Polarella glacialis]
MRRPPELKLERAASRAAVLAQAGLQHFQASNTRPRSGAMGDPGSASGGAASGPHALGISEMLIDQLDSAGFLGEIDYLYLPIDFANRCNVGYCFCNLRTAAARKRFVASFDGVAAQSCLPGFNSYKVCQVTKARWQGRVENVRRLRSSPELMAKLVQHPEWLPLLMTESGEPEVFRCDGGELPPPRTGAKRQARAQPSRPARGAAAGGSQRHPGSAQGGVQGWPGMPEASSGFLGGRGSGGGGRGGPFGSLGADMGAYVDPAVSYGMPMVRGLPMMAEGGAQHLPYGGGFGGGDYFMPHGLRLILLVEQPDQAAGGVEAFRGAGGRPGRGTGRGGKWRAGARTSFGTPRDAAVELLRAVASAHRSRITEAQGQVESLRRELGSLEAQWDAARAQASMHCCGLLRRFALVLQAKVDRESALRREARERQLAEFNACAAAASSRPAVLPAPRSPRNTSAGSAGSTTSRTTRRTTPRTGAAAEKPAALPMSAAERRGRGRGRGAATALVPPAKRRRAEGGGRSAGGRGLSMAGRERSGFCRQRIQGPSGCGAQQAPRRGDVDAGAV